MGATALLIASCGEAPGQTRSKPDSIDGDWYTPVRDEIIIGTHFHFLEVTGDHFTMILYTRRTDFDPDAGFMTQDQWGVFGKIVGKVDRDNQMLIADPPAYLTLEGEVQAELEPDQARFTYTFVAAPTHDLVLQEAGADTRTRTFLQVEQVR